MKPTDNKEQNLNKKDKGGCSPLDVLCIHDIIDAMLDDMEEELTEMCGDKPSAMDLLSPSERAQMSTGLNAYGCLRKYIDDEYVALLIALSQYEKVDFDTKIKLHIANNIKSRM